MGFSSDAPIRKLTITCLGPIKIQPTEVIESLCLNLASPQGDVHIRIVGVVDTTASFEHVGLARDEVHNNFPHHHDEHNYRRPAQIILHSVECVLVWVEGMFVEVHPVLFYV